MKISPFNRILQPGGALLSEKLEWWPRGSGAARVAEGGETSLLLQRPESVQGLPEEHK